MAKAARKFVYQGRSRDDIKERANQRGGGFDSIIKPKFKRYKIKEGKNVIRVMPPTWKSAKHYGYDAWINYGIGVDNQSYLSLSKMNKGADPIAEARQRANKSGDEEMAKELAPKQRVIMWIIDRLAEDEGPQVFECPVTVDKALSTLCFDEDTKEIILVDDPENGCDFRFYREGSGRNTDYDAAKMKLLKPSPLCDDENQQDEWMAYIEANPVPDTLNFYSYDHIQAVMGGESKKGADDDDENEAEEKPAPRARTRPAPVEDDETETAPPPRRARQPAPDPEDDQEGDAVDEAPSPRRRARAEPQPEDDETDEELQRPASRGSDKAGSSIRERLRDRRAARAEPEDDND